MFRFRITSILGGLILASFGSIGNPAELPIILTSLAANNVIEHEGQLYVRVREKRLGIMQPLERSLIGRATELAAHWLCGYTPKVNQRLDVRLQGVSLVYSNEEDGFLDVVIKLKNQKPDCKVMTYSRPSESSEQNEISSINNTSEIIVKEQRLTLPQKTQDPADTNIRIRVYPTEF